MSVDQDVLDHFDAEVNRYTRKCRQHLGRVYAFRELVLRTKPELAAETSLWFQPSQLFDGDGTLDERYHRSVNDSHFLLLKVNFEFFLSRSLCLFWDSFGPKIVVANHRRTGGMLKGVQPKAVTWYHIAISGDWSGLPTGEEAVPAHGLEQLGSLFREFIGTPLQEIIRKAQPTDGGIDRHIDAWSQIYCAFQVRHLIEHQKGKVDSRFLRSCQDHIGRTTWRERAAQADPPRPTDPSVRIRIEDRDFEQTYFVMVASLKGILEALRDSSRHLSPVQG